MSNIPSREEVEREIEGCKESGHYHCDAQLEQANRILKALWEAHNGWFGPTCPTCRETQKAMRAASALYEGKP